MKTTPNDRINSDPSWETGYAPIKIMAKNFGVSKAQIHLWWRLQKDNAVLPKITNKDRIRQNIDLFSFEIDDECMVAITEMDRGDSVAWRTEDPSRVN